MPVDSRSTSFCIVRLIHPLMLVYIHHLSAVLLVLSSLSPPCPRSQKQSCKLVTPLNEVRGGRALLRRSGLGTRTLCRHPLTSQPKFEGEYGTHVFLRTSGLQPDISELTNSHLCGMHHANTHGTQQKLKTRR